MPAAGSRRQPGGACRSRSKRRTATQDDAFAARRAAELDSYLVELFSAVNVRSSPDVHAFLSLPARVAEPPVTVYFPPTS